MVALDVEIMRLVDATDVVLLVLELVHLVVIPVADPDVLDTVVLDVPITVVLDVMVFLE